MNMFQGYRIISDQVGVGELTIVWRELTKILNTRIPGDIVEFGCYAGTASLFIRRLLDERGESGKRTFHAYDSFEGLPEKTRQDESAVGTQFKAGELAVSKKIFLQNFRNAKLKPPIVHKAWFNQLTNNDIPDKIAFAFLDGDFYDSIFVSLKLVWPRMSSGGILLIDDYGREALPGAERAVHDFFAGKPTPIIQTNHNIAYLVKA